MRYYKQIVAKIFAGQGKNSLLCTLIRGSSCKAVKNDALSSDMRTEMAATDHPVEPTK